MSKLKILVVDDDPEFIKAAKIRLESMDCAVTTASNGKEALEQIAHDRPDAAFLDIIMPVLDGMDTLEVIRKKDKDLPVFMITAYISEDRVQRAKDLGASGFLNKDGGIKQGIENILSQLKDKKA